MKKPSVKKEVIKKELQKYFDSKYNLKSDLTEQQFNEMKKYINSVEVSTIIKNGLGGSNQSERYKRIGITYGNDIYNDIKDREFDLSPDEQRGTRSSLRG